MRYFKNGLEQSYQFEINRTKFTTDDNAKKFSEMRAICSALATASNQSSVRTIKSSGEPMDIDTLEIGYKTPTKIATLISRMPKPELTREEREDCLKNHLCLGCKTKKHKGGWRKCFAYINSLGPEFKPIVDHLKDFPKRH